MAVTLNTEGREGVEVRWDAPDHVGDVQVFAQGADGEWHNTAVMPNDGLAALSYPAGFSGSSLVEVRDADGNVLDSGEIHVGDSPPPYSDAGEVDEEPVEEGEAAAAEGDGA